MTYAEMISAMDDMVGRLVRALEELGVRDNTLILFTTDNGTPNASYLSVDASGKMTRPKVFSIRNGKVVAGGKGRMDDTGTRVPLIANWPGRIKAGSETEQMVDMTDLLPTLAEVCRLGDDDVRRDGVSFAHVLFGQQNRGNARKWVFLQHREQRAIRSDSWKLYGNGRFFDLRRDPEESSPLDTTALSGEALRQYHQLQHELNRMQFAESVN